METGDEGQAWQIKLHFPQEMSERTKASQLNKFKGQWETLRPDVPVERSDKYHRRGELSDRLHAEIHNASHQDMVPALRKDGTVVDQAGDQIAGLFE
eukprot:8238710-Prorocentrum_lima.AAC.1